MEHDVEAGFIPKPSTINTSFHSIFHYPYITPIDRSSGYIRMVSKSMSLYSTNSKAYRLPAVLNGLRNDKSFTPTVGKVQVPGLGTCRSAGKSLSQQVNHGEN